MRNALWVIAIVAILSHAAADVLKVEKWTQLEPDSQEKYQGETVLNWPDPVDNDRPKALDVPTDLSKYKTLRYYVWSARPVESRITLILSSDDKSNDGADYYSTAFVADFQGWRRFILPLSALGVSRSPLGLDQVSSVFFSSKWAHNLDPQTSLKVAGFQFSTEPIPGFDRPAGELLINRSFEIDGNNDGRPDGWGGGDYKTQAAVGIDSQNAHSGDYALRIAGKDAKDRGGAARNFGPDLTNPDALYILSAWVKTEGASQSSLRTSARITSVDASGKVIKSDYRVCDPGPYDWRRYEWSVSLPPETHRFNIVLFHHGEGTAWFDDVSLQVVEPAEVVQPKNGAIVADGKPVLEWKAPAEAKSTIEIAPDGDFGSDQVRRYETRGARFALPESLPLGKTYTWRATSVAERGIVVAAAPGEPGQGLAYPHFFAGSQEARLQMAKEKTSEESAMYKHLLALATRNDMWEKFDLLGKALEESLALAQPGAPNAAQRLQENRERWKELDLRMPWWNKIFLDNEALFLEDLDLDYPGLEKVKAAARKKDWPAAREALAEYFRKRSEPNYYNKFRKPWKAPAVKRTNIAADRILNHKYPIHSYKDPVFDLGPGMNWHVNPIVDREWPTKLHRHTQWRTFMNAYRQTGDEKYAQEMRQQILDWAKDNPIERWVPATGRFAWSTLNATVRIYGTWIDMYYILRHSPVWNGDLQFVYLTEIREHGRYLMTHAARQGNWVVAEARGLVELGVMFPEFKEAKQWRDEGFARLKRELDIQVFDDGIHVERTPGYHSMVMACFMQPLQLGLLNKVDIEGREYFLKKIEKMYEPYLYGAMPDKRMAQIGDGGLMSVAGKMTQGWNIFRREDMLYVFSDGKEGKPPVHRSYAFRQGGFFVSRSAWNDPNALWSIVDWGGFVGHCHYDMGNFLAYAYGSRLLIDAGRYAYAWPERKYFKETTGHNTLMVDGKNQEKNDPLKDKWVATDQFDVFWGLTDNTPPLLFERNVVFRQPSPAGPGYWLVVDRLSPSAGDSGEHRIDQRWHALEKMTGEVAGQSVVFRPDPKKTDEKLPALVVANAPQPNLETQIVEGWVSYGWYKKDPTHVAQFSFQKAKAPLALVTVIYPTPPEAQPASVRVEPLQAQLDGRPAPFHQVSAVAVAIDDNGKQYRDTWIVRHTDAGLTEAGDLKTDGRVAMVRGDADQWLVSEGAILETGGNPLFHAAAAVQGAGAVRRDDTLDIVATEARNVRVLGAPRIVVNGKETKGGAGQIDLGNVKSPEIPPPPRADGPIRFELDPEEDAGTIQATAYTRTLEKGYRPPQGAVLVEAEKFSGQGNGAVEITEKKVGASGGMSFLHWDYAGHWLEWTFDVPADGKYSLVVRECSSEPVMMRKLTIDGKPVSVGEAIEFSGTGGYSNQNDDWRAMLVVTPENEPFALRLGKGKHVVRLENIDGVSMNVDWIALTPAK